MIVHPPLLQRRLLDFGAAEWDLLVHLQLRGRALASGAMVGSSAMGLATLDGWSGILWYSVCATRSLR